MRTLIACALALGCLLASAVQAQALPVTLTATPSGTISPVSVALEWSAPGAVSCVASGRWTGEKGASGSEVLTDVLAPGASFRLDCVGEQPGNTGSANLTWTPPMENTDGSVYTNPKGFFIHYGAAPGELHSAIALFVPTASSYTVEDLEPGTHYFALRAVSATDQQSALSNVAQKTITADPAPTGSASASVEVDTQPNPPEAVAAQ